jgi:hypothetical protein
MIYQHATTVEDRAIADRLSGLAIRTTRSPTTRSPLWYDAVQDTKVARDTAGAELVGAAHPERQAGRGTGGDGHGHPAGQRVHRGAMTVSLRSAWQ